MRLAAFVRRAAALLFAAAVAGFVGIDCNEMTVKARVGVLGGVRMSWASKRADVRRALERFRDERVDAVVMLGELTAGGAETQYAELAKLWRNVMPAGVRLVLVRGPEEDRSWKSGYCGPFPAHTQFLPPEGGELEVAGVRFGAGYFKNWNNRSGRPWFFSQGRYALTDEIGSPERTFGNVYSGSMSGITLPEEFERMKGLDGVSQGLLVKAYSGEVHAHRLDFTVGEEVAEPWKVVPGRRPPERREEARAPQFWDDARLAVIRGTERDGRPVWTLKFPPVLARHTGVRAFYYEVSVAKVGVIRRVSPPGFWLSEDHERQAISVTIPAANLPAKPKFSVIPVSSLGKRGRPLVP